MEASHEVSIGYTMTSLRILAQLITRGRVRSCSANSEEYSRLRR
ncbi:MAG TPA: hypothetical protein VKY26_04930 [Actinomycetota bacterium]|nr:hypothetical protein [Actinomycetota bacterium]